LHSEDDGDVHLVLQDAAGHTMIAEAPTASCISGATAYRRHQMATARAAVKLCGKAEVVGVAFFDFFHGQDGVAPNAIELHPILKFRCLASAATAIRAKAERLGLRLRRRDGDGPYYTGPVRVVGPDHYHLDRDGDGFACENS
jgi:hypothetical protein